MSVVVVVVLGGLAVLLGLGAWSRRGETKGDPPGVRSVCSFAGGHGYVTDEEREAAEDAGPGAFGEGILRAMLPSLASQGATLGEPDMDDYGWAVTVTVDGVSGYVVVGYVGDPDADWLVTVVDPSSGGPPARDVLPVVDNALRSLDGVTHIAWHARHLHMAGDDSSGRPTPVD